MIRWNILSVSLILLLAVLAIASRWLGLNSTSPGMSILAANLCQPGPCWQGMRPGLTDLDTARQHIEAAGGQILSNSAALYTGEMCWSSMAAPFWRNCAYTEEHGLSVQRVALQLPVDTISFGDAVMLFGDPVALEMCWVVNSGAADLPRRFLAAFVTFEDNIWVMAYNPYDVDKKRFDPAMYVLRIAFNQAPDPTWNPANTLRLKWRGFTGLQAQQGTCRPQ